MILVMGATGHIGSKIVTHLLSNGQKVRCAARHFPSKDYFKGAELAAGDANSVAFLADAMRGCSAVFTMIPSDLKAEEARYSQNKFGEVTAEAIEETGIRKVVNLSSVGAELESGTGPILGLHDQEERLNQITHADIVHLRPTFFMENLLAGIPSIISMNKFFGTVPEDVPTSMIATRDIAARAAFLLMNPDFKSHNVEHLLGERDLTYKEVIQVLGKALQKPDLEYVQVSKEDMHKTLHENGLSDDWADAMVELADATSNGTLSSTVQRSKLNTTATSIEEFARTTFLEAYKKASSSETQRRSRPSQERGGEMRP